jgi:hypothetical protein
MDREGWLEREEAAWPELVNAAAAVPADRREVEGVVPGWSTHDLVWHCAYWAGYASDVLEQIRRGEPLVEREDDDAWQAEILAAGRDLSWDEILARVASGCGRRSRRSTIRPTRRSNGSPTTRSITMRNMRRRSERSAPLPEPCAPSRSTARESP